MSAENSSVVSPSEPSPLSTARLYIEIARPRVMALVVFTGLPALLLGRDVWPTLGETLLILSGTACMGGASSAFNAYIEREKDALMARTRRRPLPAAAVLPKVVVWYGWLLTFLGTVLLSITRGGPLAAAIGLATVAFYVGVYTVWLKPRTPQNIVIGGAAGSTAPLIASAAVDGTVSAGAWILFLIIFLWTPPHTWGIFIFRKKEYEAASFPMMPSVVGDQGTRWRSLAYTVALVLVSLTPVWLGYLGAFYGVLAFALGLWFLSSVVRSLRVRRPVMDYRVFKDSLVYLALLILVMLAELTWMGLSA